MSTKCIGYKHSKGDMYSDKDRKEISWNNHVFFCINDEDPKVFGFSSVELKIPDSELFAMSGCSNEAECQLYVNREINAIYGLIGDKIGLKRIEKVVKPELNDPNKNIKK